MLLPKVINLICVKNVARPLLISTRNYPGMKHEVYDYIQWVRPAKIPATDPLKSGDLEKMKKIDEKELLLNFEKSKLLETANELVRSKFSVELNPRKEAVKLYVDEMIKKVQRHDSDYGSMEAKLAKMTAVIRAGQVALEENPKNKKMKQQIKELIEKRKKFLKFLRRYDYKRFEYMLEQLDIKYMPAPDHFHWIARKEAMRSLTRRFCRNIKENRLDTYKQILQAQQLGFLENKIKNLEFIRNEQIECKVPVTITNEQINKVKKQYEELKHQREEEDEIRRKNEVRDDYEIKL
ncbi:small ribosomal subunit protein uS15m [Chironomus tepperi]|uniref:small ribosomal subunit protein uS15m n=1 Tax=Chironomus tepperi TaxID=113505 RepID=UPI00391F53E6